MLQLLNWNYFPNPTLFKYRGKLSVRVSIPTFIRYCFGDGAGTTSNETEATVSNDVSVA